jgi:hypothetical protein
VGLRQRDNRERADELIRAVAGLALAAIAWLPVVSDCLGGFENQPVTYTVRFGDGSMAHMATCPRDEAGQQQRCATWSWAEKYVGTATSFDFEDLDVPTPATGAVFILEIGAAIDPSGNRSDGPCDS